MGCLENDIKRIAHFRLNEPFYDMLECIIKIDFNKQTTSLAYRSHRMRLFRENLKLGISNSNGRKGRDTYEILANAFHLNPKTCDRHSYEEVIVTEKQTFNK